MTRAKKPRVAILGAGIMGGSTALYLARKGVNVSLFDAASEPFSAASRWNEGKIHLGYLYSCDTSLHTARKILPGSLAFKNMVEDLIGTSIEPAITRTDDIYLCHQNSLVKPDAMQAYFEAISQMVTGHPNAANYLSDVSNCQSRRLTKTELDNISNTDKIKAGFHVPERSVSTVWIADCFVDALCSQTGIEQFMNSRVTHVYPEDDNDPDGSWYVKANNDIYGPFDYVVNSLWEGRLIIDQRVGMELPQKWTNRYRVSAFLRVNKPLDLPSALIATGPFGDIKNYNGRDFYLSWYPKGLLIESSAVEPPFVKTPNEEMKQEFSNEIITALGKFLPKTSLIRDCIEQVDIRGGWVFAQGIGELSDPLSTLHHRSDYGITRKGTYISVDTGKYSTGPWLARQIADMVL